MFKMDKTNIVFLTMLVSLAVFAALIVAGTDVIWVFVVLVWMIVLVMIGVVGYRTEE